MNKNIDGIIGMLDSGVGGLTVAREIYRLLPDKELIYYGDTLHLPYGPRSEEEVTGFVFRIIDFLIAEKKAETIVLACNTATAYTLEKARKRYSLPIYGTLEGACQKAVRETRNDKIGVIGTEGTIKSQAYKQELIRLSSQVKVDSQACPDFVELVEDGNFDGPEVYNTAETYLAPLRKEGVDVLILGCTHYPYLMPVIQEVMGEGVSLINPAVEVAREVKEIFAPEVKQHPEQTEKISQQEFLVSDMSRISTTFLKKGSEFLQLPSLNFKENNIFGERE